MPMSELNEDRTVLSLHDVWAGYVKHVPILRGVSLSLERGTVTTIVGPNGAGKSTLLRTLAGLVPVHQGKIFLSDAEITAWSVHNRVDRGLALCAQGRNNFPRLSVKDNLDVSASAIRRADSDARLDEILELFPVLREKWHVAAGSLSGGQQQLLEMALALMSGPSVLMLDEPSMGLSPANVKLVMQHVHSIAHSGRTVLMVEQNARQGLGIADFGIVLKRGQIAACEESATLLSGDVLRGHLLSHIDG